MDRFNAELEGMEIRLEAEVVVLPVDELGIGNQAVFVPAFGLPVTFGVFEAGENETEIGGLFDAQAQLLLPDTKKRGLEDPAP